MKRFLHLWLSFAVLVFALWAVIWEPSAVSLTGNISNDMFQQFRPRAYSPAPVRIIDIDDESIARYGQWPWPRFRLGKLVERLSDVGASAIVFDMVFSEPDRTSPEYLMEYWPNHPLMKRMTADEARFMPNHDRLFAQSIKTAPVVVGFSASSKAPADKNPLLKTRFITMGPDPTSILPAVKSAVSNLPLFEKAASGNGAFNFIADHDGIIRRVPLLININKKLYPALSAEALRVAQGSKNIMVKSAGKGGDDSGAVTGVTEVRIGQLPVPVEPNSEVRLYYSRSLPERYVPAWKILNGSVDPEKITGHILFIGTSAKGLMDLRFNTLKKIIPGVEVHAQLTEQLINGSFLQIPYWSKAVVCIFLFFVWLITVIVVSRVKAIWLGFFTILCILSTYGGAWYLFTEKKLFLDPLFPSLAIIGVFMSCGFIRFLVVESERRWIQNAFSHYISPNLVNHLIKHPDDLKLGGEKRVCSFVLTDLEGFTSFMEKSDPAEVTELLNTYIDEMLKIAFSYDATLDRIVGDAIALLFSAPVVQEDHAERAVACAQELSVFAQKFSKEKQKEGIRLGGTRIGVHTGPVIIGNFGGKTIFDYRALGDPINTCSRLETVNKQLGTRICVSKATTDLCSDFIGRPVGTLILKGKTEGIEVFEPLTPEAAENERMLGYKEAFSLLEKDPDAAKAAFNELGKLFPPDPLALFHLNRLNKGEAGVVVTMKKK